ncbi:MAG: signal peptidase I [Myxococcota bacterium]
MNQYLKPGRIIACILSVTLVFTVWGLVYEPGGLGSNILLGLAVAIMIVYYGTKNLGAFLDDLFFEDGSREKAFTMRRARNELKLYREKLAKSSKKLRANRPQQLLAFETSLNELEQHTLNPRPNLKLVEHTMKQVDVNAKAFLGKVPRKGLVGGFESLVFALLGALALRILIVEPFQIPSGSMIPTLLVGDHLFVSKLSYGVMNPFSRQPSYLVRWASPKPGQVMIFEAPEYVPSNAGATWIKRVIAGPGQRVQVKDSVVNVDGKPYQHVEKDKLIKFYDYYMSHNVWHELSAFENREEVTPSVTHAIYMAELDEKWPTADQRELPGLTCDENSCLVADGHIFVMGDNRGGSADSRMWGALPIDNVKGRALFVWMSVDGRKEWFSLGRFSLPQFRWSRWFGEIR